MRVVKNTVAGVAFDKGSMKGLGARLAGPSAVIFGGEGALAISKLVVAEVESEQEAQDPRRLRGRRGPRRQGVDTLSKVPSKPELLAMTLAAFFGPVSELSRGMEGLFTRDQRTDRGAGKEEAAGGIRGLTSFSRRRGGCARGPGV